MRKTIFSVVLTVVFSLLMLHCRKEPTPSVEPAEPIVNLPTEVNLGESIVYLNGEVFDGVPDIYYRPFDQLFFAVFLQTKDNADVGQLINLLAFSFLPLRQDNYPLITERLYGIAAYPGFGQIFAEDLTGYTYEVRDKEKGYFNITYLDTVEQVVKGQFKVKFHRTSTNGVTEDLQMPEWLFFEGVFHQKYTIK